MEARPSKYEVGKLISGHVTTETEADKSQKYLSQSQYHTLLRFVFGKGFVKGNIVYCSI